MPYQNASSSPVEIELPFYQSELGKVTGTHLVEQALHAALRRFIGRSDGNLSKEVTSGSNSPCFDIAHQLITSHRKALGLLALEG